MKLADLHCDTPYELYKKKLRLADSPLHISLEKAKNFEKYIQAAAVWSDTAKRDDDCMEDFLAISSAFEAQAGNMLCRTADELSAPGKTKFILTVEDARLLAGKLERAKTLYERGVRIVTLVWKGETCIGGSWDTESGLTDFGIEAVRELSRLGIICDVSHASRQTLHDTCSLAAPVIATHSSSRVLCDHRRNLYDEDFRLIAQTGGIVGISLCPKHIAPDNASADDVLRHIEHYLTLDEKRVALGCDFDGVDTLPRGIDDVSGLEALYEKAVAAFGAATADDVFFNNAYNFLVNNI